MDVTLFTILLLETEVDEKDGELKTTNIKVIQYLQLQYLWNKKTIYLVPEE